MSAPPSPSHSYSPRLLRYATAVIAVTVPVAVGAILRIASAPPRPAVIAGVLVFAAAALAAEAKPVPLDEQGQHRVSLAFVFLLSAQVLFGWQYAVPAALVAAALVEVFERGVSLRGAFNTATYGLSAFAAALPAFVFGLDGARIGAADAGKLVVLAFSGGAAYLLTNVTLVTLAVTLAQNLPLRRISYEFMRHSAPAFVIMAFISALAVSLWKVNPAFEILLAGPLFALALYQRYAYRTVLAVRDSETDALTGLGNHRSFQTHLREALAMAASTRSDVSLALIDLDDFKGINDRFGHPVGDTVLREVAGLLREGFGAGNAYRIGGEEFALILQDTPGQTAYADLERVHHRLWQTVFPHGEPLTVSAGVATFPDHAGDRDHLLEVADASLYWAKNHGKNRSCLYSDSIIRIYTPAEIATAAERTARLRAAEGLIRVVDAKDTYAGAHSQSVSRLAEGIARAMGLDPEVVDQVRLAGLLHDLGKIAIPDRVLQKPGRLDPDELRVMREHPELGYRLLEGLGVSPVDRWIRHHHEWWDGSGYPLGLAGDEIPLGSRIILVADAFDAMTSDRCYRAAGTTDAAIAELRRRSWAQFDARIVSALERYLASEASHLSTIESAAG
ncbi:MAG TPA: diguanylate cyclase [Gaiellales bacterium]|jgi:diguanylate cyclase (GGDEF)-like protein/putative nucleotidyltransferase with HDIG domain|nr:diguanylate cyclase [Gaiellales bacterium]